MDIKINPPLPSEEDRLLTMYAPEDKKFDLLINYWERIRNHYLFLLKTSFNREDFIIEWEATMGCKPKHYEICVASSAFSSYTTVRLAKVAEASYRLSKIYLNNKLYIDAVENIETALSYQYNLKIVAEYARYKMYLESLVALKNNK